VRFRDGSQIQFPLGSQYGYADPAVYNTHANPPPPPPTGLQTSFASNIVDTNGNVISISQGYGEWLTWKDTDNRTVTWNSSGIHYQDSNGTQETVQLSYAQFPNTPVPIFSTPVPDNIRIQPGGVGRINEELSSIILPDGLSYTFQYNEYGEIVKITYPSGGYTRYDYQAFSRSGYEWSTTVSGLADDREVVAKHVCRASVTPAGATTPSGYVGSSVQPTCSVPEDTTTYTRTPTSGVTTAAIVVDPLGNQTIYGFNQPTMAAGPNLPSGYEGIVNAGTSSPSLETSRSVYQGTSTLLRTVNTSYEAPSNPGLYTSFPGSQTTILPNGMESYIQWYRDYSIYPYSVTLYDRIQDETFGTIGAEADNLVEKREYGFGQSKPFRVTDYSYLILPNYQNYSVYILNRMTEKSVYDGSRNLLADTQYTYDNPNYSSIVQSGAAQHGTAWNTYGPSYTTRGNATTISRWLNTNGIELATVNTQFDDAGNILQQKDPNGNVTTYSYTDFNPNWGSAPCAPPSLVQGKSQIMQVTNAMGQKTSYTYNSCSGTLATTTDPNGQTTSFGYDRMDRRTSANYPDGGQTTLQYSDDSPGAALPILITTTKTASPDPSVTSTTTLDGLSRVARTQLTSDTYGTDTVDTTYDADGNIASVSNPYRTTSDSTYGLTQYAYDALGRKTLQIQPDNSTQPGGSTLQWVYNNNVTDFFDEMGNHWQRTSDAQGRLIKVLEPDTSNNPSIETDYSYDGLDNLLRVDQWGGSNGSSGDHIRTFTYDGISRLLTASNPESGTTTYSYDGNGNVLTKADGRGIAINYQYDPLNRLTAKTYSDGITPGVFYTYDGAPGNNAVGRLVGEETSAGRGTSPIYTARYILQYDPMGRILAETQCALANCSSGAAHYRIDTAYDLAGNVTSTTNGMPSSNSANPYISLGFGYDAANRLALVTSGLTGPTLPGKLFEADSAMESNLNLSVPPYGPMGLTAAQLGQNQDTMSDVLETRAYTNRGWLQNITDTGNVAEINPTPGTASLTITGSDSSNPTGVATSSTGSIYISGSEQSVNVNCNAPSGCIPIYDTGTVSVMVGGPTGTAMSSANYGQNSSPDTIAADLATGLTSSSKLQPGAPQINAVASGSDIALTSTTTGAATNDSISVSLVETGTPSLFPNGPSFSVSASGPTMTGGTDAPPPTYDSGTITATVNHVTTSVPYGQGSAEDSIATALATAITNSGAGVNATPNDNGNGITLTANPPGGNTNYCFDTAVTPNTTNYPISFTISPLHGCLTGGSGM